MKFLEEEAPIENLNSGPTTNEQDGEDEDLVRKKKQINFLIFYFLFILVRSYLNLQIHTTTSQSLIE